ncbi:hypothetical protein BV25DRAFT_1918935 [Artomyces pyxidatus]|uniref:Uncharacterized protein n=1 Tax=Artomyces pyxidatus TaxID=48021 RepID=A0ACB8SQF7_9AGAM|nr:hypothetical protein BV25DRAFT_1918935 [Artomyces pyxidatus]
MPAYCGGGDLVRDTAAGFARNIGYAATIKLLAIINDNKASETDDLADVYEQLGGDVVHPYDPTSKPSPYSSPLARFRPNRTSVSKNMPSTLQTFIEARCEITSKDLPVPLRLQATENIIAVLGAMDSHNPSLHVFKTDCEEDGDIFNQHALSVDVGLCDLALNLHLDRARNLVYVADKDRVKSYRWTVGDQNQPSSSTPVHTLKTRGFSGPLLLKDGGFKFIRAGSTGIAVWDIDTIATHGATGNKIVGKKIKPEDLKSARDGGKLELSQGTGPSHRIDASDLSNIKEWIEHPNDARKMLVTYEMQYGLSCVDLETHRTVARYVGHGAFIGDLATSRCDPHCFITAAGDSIVRMYDARLPTPVLAIEHSSDSINSALYEHVGAHPFVIIGGSKSEQIKVWDVRAKVPLYELSTGNNQVTTLAWDDQRQTLELPPNFPIPPAEMKERNDPNRGRDWPERAFHAKGSFGVPLDSVSHRVYRYQFRDNANPDIVPSSGKPHGYPE